MTAEPSTVRLANWICAFDYDGVPRHVLELCKMSLLDALGCAFAARTGSEAAEAALGAIETCERSGPCTIIGGERRASVVDAVFANGLLIRALDFNDYLPRDPNDGARLGSHPSDNMAVGLAVAEEQGSSGRDFLTAIVMGYELNGRLLRLFDGGSYWDNTTSTGLVSTAVAGRLMHLDEDSLASAIGFGMAHGVTHKSVRRGHISAAKFLADPIVARNGVFSARLAARGVRGPTSVFDGAHGLGQAVFTRGRLSELVRPLDRRYMFEGVCIKAYPCFANGQAAVSAALEARKSFGGQAEDIESVKLTVADAPAITSQLADSSRRLPTNRETADHSLHFVVSAALLDGCLDLNSFENDRWNDPTVRRLIEVIEILPDDAWNRREHGGAPASIRVTMRDGSVHTADVAYQFGHVGNAMSMEDVVAKFTSNVKACLDRDRARAIAAAVAGLDAQPTSRPLMNLLGGPAASSASARRVEEGRSQ